MDIQRLRNLTTKRLHTDISHVYQDIEFLTGEKGILTHSIPNAVNALEPYLRETVKAQRFWDGEHDTEHTGDFEIAPMDDEQKAAFFERFKSLPSPFAGKHTIAVKT